MCINNGVQSDSNSPMNSGGISCVPTYICKPNFRSGKTLRLFTEDYEQSAVRQGKARYPLHRKSRVLYIYIQNVGNKTLITCYLKDN